MKPLNAQAVTAVDSHPALSQAAAKIFYSAATDTDPALFLTQAMPLASQALGGQLLAQAAGH